VLTRIVLPTVVLVTGLFAAGCGSSTDKSTTTFGCADLCADFNRCPTTTTQADCPTVCAGVTSANSKMATSTTCPAGGTSSFATMMACVGQHPSEVCTIGQQGAAFSCTLDSLAYFSCAQGYCTANPTDAGCEALHGLIPTYF
jgi:hypothetical protein